MPGGSRFDYHAYLASREWALLKRAVRERAGSQCERCGDAEITATHHLTYARLGHESLDDLQGVCGGCHDFLGGISDVDPALTPSERLDRLVGSGRTAVILGMLLSPDPRAPGFIVPTDWSDEIGFLYQLLAKANLIDTEDSPDVTPPPELARQYKALLDQYLEKKAAQ